MSQPPDSPGEYVFLSYASADRERALHLADLLETNGIAVWIDRKSIAGGTSWGAEIVRGIRECSALVLASSPAALGSANVHQEIQLAWESRRPIVPLILQPTATPDAVAYALAGRQWIEVLDRADAEWLPRALRALTGLGIHPSRTAPTLGARSNETTAPDPMPGEASPRNNLPVQVTSFVGREREVAEVKERLRGTRLLTLTGTGGCGKTRLALQVAGEIGGEYPDGVWLVDLAPLADPDLVPATVATAAEVRGGPGQPILTTLLSALRSRRLLLILDNCEHLIDASAHLVDAIMRGCPGVRILATSREALGIAGEVAWRVPSLGVDLTDQSSSLDDLARSEAVRLFVDRALGVKPAFAATAETLPPIARICQRLDGIPLAIELAATRVKVLSVEQIAARLHQRFRLLTGGSRAALPRQQTLGALVGWSYDLLTDAERTLFNRLSVFSGDFALEAVEAVCSDEEVDQATGAARPAALLSSRPLIVPEDILDLLAELVDKSLVVAEGESGSSSERYRLLETLRQYGQERLVATGEAEVVHRRHAQYYLDVGEQSEPYLRRAEQLIHLARLDREHDNLRAALRWFLDNREAEEGLRLVDALVWFWAFRGFLPEGRDWTTQFLQLPGAAISSATRASVLAWAGGMACMRGDVSTGRALLVESLAMAQKLEDDRALAWAMLSASRFGGPDKEQWYHATDRELAEGALARYRAASDRWGIAETLSRLGRLAFLQGDADQARLVLTECLAVARTVGDRRSVALALEFHGEAISAESDTQSGASLNESLRLYRELGDQTGIVSVENLLGRLDCLYERYATGREHYRASLRLTRDWAWMQRVTGSLDGLAVVAAGQGQPERALRLAAASARLQKEAAVEASPPEQAELDRAIASVRQALDQDAAAAAWADGQAMTLEEAAAYGLNDDGPQS